MIKQILKNADITLRELNYVACSKGPGRFTGIRIAIGIAQSFSLSLKIPILDISTLSIIAEKAWRKYKIKKILIAISAKLGQVYWGEYIRHDISLWIGEKTESLIHINTIEKKMKNFKEKWTLVGDGWEKIKFNNFSISKKSKILYPNAQDIIPLALFKIKKKEFLHFTEVSNNYLDTLF
ncbi:tRNA (adenosine(37)-N6)-threonylcarbamoyltransferase complex dimerization subunit type 1 TsaB [Buchnera aphidicola]|uniref:tRNA (adenosine(37)-N6)-threonylcarbamoyltransferase complex dimerization subunit type 1 TsaB n=1 Tax=Buchnera aphidicola TaxID=9 RepID=UPI0034640CD1